MVASSSIILRVKRSVSLLVTPKDEVVLDPFMGSGSTAIAALQTGRKYIGYEIDPEYVKLAEKRIAAAG